MYLVLCSSYDSPALWAYEGLKQLGVAPIELVLAESLALASQWEHRLDRNGTHLKIVLADGRVICGSRVRGTINRLHAPSPRIAQQAVDSDREYAQSELQAFYLSWLNGLPGVVINRPTPVGLCGAWYHASEWASRASRAGLRITRHRQSGHDNPDQSYQRPLPHGIAKHTVIAFRGEVFGREVSRPIADACVRLASSAKAELLGVDMYLDVDGQWTFAHASTSPDLSLGGAPLLMRLAQELTRN